MHVTDNAFDTVRMAKIFFHKNTLNFYNKIDHNYSKNIKNKLNKYRSKLITKRIMTTHCICSSFVLGLYNLRQPQDLDYIHNESELFNTMSHNKYESFYPTKINDLIYNPDNYFYYNGLKCSSLDVVKQMKIKEMST